MEIYLVRHAKAEPGQDDFSRRLTERGREDSDRVARLLRSKKIAVSRIEHSPLVRAAETARIIAGRLDALMRECEDLRPERDAAGIRARLMAEQPDSVMLVGHNPFMEELAGLLCCDDADPPVLVFHTASVARLVSANTGLGWRLCCDWLITPALIAS